MKIKPVGLLIKQLKKPLQELTYGHRLGWGEILGLVKSYLEVHCPDGQEKYTSGGSPVFFYGGVDFSKFKVKGKNIRVRPLGDILLDMEESLMNLSYDHDMQWYEVLSLVKISLERNCPEGQEKVKGKTASFYYGPKEGLKKFKNHL